LWYLCSSSWFLMVWGALGSSILILACVNITPGTFDHIALVTSRIFISNSNSGPRTEVQSLFSFPCDCHWVFQIWQSKWKSLVSNPWQQKPQTQFAVSLLTPFQPVV
jgi:hypothetical protein